MPLKISIPASMVFGESENHERTERIGAKRADHWCCKLTEIGNKKREKQLWREVMIEHVDMLMYLQSAMKPTRTKWAQMGTR